MSKEKESPSAVSQKLIDAVDNLVDEVCGTGKKKPGRKAIGEEEPSYDLEQKVKVLNLRLNLEKLRLKVSEEQEGGGFDD